MDIKRTMVALLLVGVSVLSLGCGTKSIVLTYTPKSLKMPPKEVDVVVTVFSSDEGVGERRNVYGSKAEGGGLAEGQDAGAWLANAIGDELANRGYQVSKIEEAVPEAYDILITGNVKDAYIMMGRYTTPTVIMEVTVIVFWKGLPLLDETFQGRYTCRIAFGSAPEYAAALEGALHMVMNRILPRIEEAIG